MKKLVLLMTLFVLGWSCGGRDPLSIRPKTATVAPGQALQFEVRPVGTSVVWSVQETGGGTITQTGLYTAPIAWGVFHVLATASATVQASATVTVTSPVQITAPSPQDVVACEPKQLTATVTGSSDVQVVWGGADAACGMLTPDGLFTAARNIVYCVVAAQAHADPTRVVQVTVNVAPERVLGVAVAPPSVSVPASGTTQFSATVTTSCGTFAAGE